MRPIVPRYEILTNIDGIKILHEIEAIARTCYKSEDKIGVGSAEKLMERLLKSHHDVMLEFASIQVRFICNRGMSHELVRHRLCSFAQESTRYVNYAKKDEIEFIIPTWFNEAGFLQSKEHWLQHMINCEREYMQAVTAGLPPQHARGLLPLDLKTEIVVQANLREWRHILELRTANAAHPSMRQLMIPLLAEFKQKIPLIFDDILEDK